VNDAEGSLTVTTIPRGIPTAAAVLTAALAVPLPLAAATAAAATTTTTATTTASPTRPGAVAPAPRLALPRPTGPYAVGRETLHLVDHTRPDPWVPQAGARELMVSVYYPARPGTGRPEAYMGTEEARLFLRSRGLEQVLSAETLSNTRISSRGHTRPVPGRRPLVALSPGFSVSRHTLTMLAEELASRGFIAAAIDHAYESTGTAFPDGRILTCVACELAEGREALALAAHGRAADISFVLDELLRRYPDRIDRDRIGAAGHSLGGNAASTTMAADARVAAGVNMDGTFFAPVPAGGLGGRPFLLLGAEAHHSPGSVEDETWDRDWPLLADGRRYWLTVAGATHIGFSDLSVLAEQAGLTDPDAPLSGARHGQIMRDYVAAFFDLHLRRVPQPLLDGPAPAYPEVAFPNA
jgi:predicted dienelactone hydrolase